MKHYGNWKYSRKLFENISQDPVADIRFVQKKLSHLKQSAILTVKNGWTPDVYVRIARKYFMEPESTYLELQGLGGSIKSLQDIGSIIELRSYGKCTFSKNDSLRIDLHDKYGNACGAIRKARKSILILRSDNFKEIIAKEEEQEKCPVPVKNPEHSKEEYSKKCLEMLEKFNKEWIIEEDPNFKIDPNFKESDDESSDDTEEEQSLDAFGTFAKK